MNMTVQVKLLTVTLVSIFSAKKPRKHALNDLVVTYIWDIKDLSKPVLTGFYKSENYGIDHNQYVSKGTSYQSNYGGGLRLLDVSSIPSDPSGDSVFEKGFFDIYPEDDEEPALDFVGA